MPELSKDALSKFIRTDCKRQLRFYLTTKAERSATKKTSQEMPDPQDPRPGMAAVTQAGHDWQAEKVEDLKNVFGAPAVVSQPKTTPSGVRFNPIDLANVLSQNLAAPGSFIVEGQFQVGRSFKNALGIAGHDAPPLDLTYSELRPDLIQVAAPQTFHEIIDAAGEVEEVASSDERLQLRVIDIKLTSEPSASYQLEVSYYSMALAGWLEDQKLSDRYIVARDCAIWPGSHDASVLVTSLIDWTNQGHQPTSAELHAALNEDLEEVPFEVFALRLHRLLKETVPEVLSVPWRDLDWHVDNRCRTCDFLGGPWQKRVNGQLVNTWSDDHCRPEAERKGHLSRVPFVSRGASSALRLAGVGDVASLAVKPPTDSVFDSHHVLRATRTVVSERAKTLDRLGPAQIAPQSGTSAVMPKWSDLRIYISADFDPSSAITFSLGLKAFWIEPVPYGVSVPNRKTRAWPAETFVVDAKDVRAEERELLSFLRKVQEILDECRQADPETTVQFYLWDQLEAKHFGRIIGRHLSAILAAPGSLKNLAWLFPPDEVVQNPDQATRRSPITVVRDVVRATVAAPLAHYYTLLELAAVYHDPKLPVQMAEFNVHPLFKDYLSDQIPAERAHEIWARTSKPNWSGQIAELRRTVATRLRALEEVTKQLSVDLGPHLSAQVAPQINITPPRWKTGLSLDGQLWYAFSKLDAALRELEVHRIRAMPPHEREARFKSAWLERRLDPKQEKQAFQNLAIPAGRRQGARVYQMRPTSSEVSLREGDFTYALSPTNEPGFLDKSAFRLLDGTPLYDKRKPWTKTVDGLTQVTVLAIDRDRQLIALEPSRYYPTMLDDLEAQGLADLTNNVMLDPTYTDFFTKRLEQTLKKIGNPVIASRSPAVTLGTWAGAPSKRGPKVTGDKPPADVLWDGAAMQGQSAQRGSLAPIRTKLESAGVSLNSSQWQAWEAALTNRLQLIWGPPGTGKSRTLEAVIVGSIVAAATANKPLRILMTASTYTAVDNVLLPVFEDLVAGGIEPSVEIVRLRSEYRAPDALSAQIDLPLNRHDPSDEIRDLRARLKDRVGLTVVGGPPQQIHNLLTTGSELPVQEFFDLIVIDEATQVGVPESTLALAGLAGDGAVVIAGDHLQLPPIRAAEAPLNLEAYVGSIYEYCRDIQNVQEAALEVNYRSNKTIVDFARRARYRRSLESYSPDLALNLAPTSGQPTNWPSDLIWTPEWEALLDPKAPTVSFVHPDASSSQWNPFEAEAVTSLVCALRERMLNQLASERDPATGQVISTVGATCSGDEDFWRKRVGIVTPHRAQQSLIIKRLQATLGGSPDVNALIRDAVDTVERFQGQERDLIIVSFALGDPDAIAEEEEFLLSFRRFNVMASRARAKVIVFIAQQIVDHLAHDNDVLKDSGLLKTFVQSFCDQSRPMQLDYNRNGKPESVIGEYRFRRS